MLEPLGPACSFCAEPLPEQNPLICGACCMQRPCVDRVLTSYRFTEPLRTLIHAFKYESALYLSSLLIELMWAAKDPGYTTDCLIPVPLHQKRLQERGFNQAAILAVKLGQKLQKPYELYSCDKILATLPQAGLSAKERKTNLKHAFQARPVPYQHVTLVDDLFTTGSTANEVAKTLKQQGVQRVDVWCCARACW
ncbi:MAG: amidophosphoribosyltransferase [Legionella sp.]|nr:MAG: amidophosphoribosyltransferase [Legionella sp.]